MDWWPLTPSTRGNKEWYTCVCVCACVCACGWLCLWSGDSTTNRTNGNEVMVYGQVDLLDDFMNNGREKTASTCTLSLIHGLTGRIFSANYDIIRAHDTCRNILGYSPFPSTKYLWRIESLCDLFRLCSYHWLISVLYNHADRSTQRSIATMRAGFRDCRWLQGGFLRYRDYKNWQHWKRIIGSMNQLLLYKTRLVGSFFNVLLNTCSYR